MMKQMQKGFTLIELMIVVAIIGILAAIALPAYQDYIARSQVSEAMTLAGGFKTPISVYYSENGSFPTALVAANTANPTSSQLTGNLSGKYATITYTAASGIVTATMQNSRATGNITFSPNADATVWTCGGSVDTKFRPSSCK